MHNNVAKSKICIQCKNIFVPNSNKAIKCINCCTYVCKYCGKTFISRRNRKITFCSKECTNNWQNTVSAKKEAHYRTIGCNGSGKIQQCKTCKKEFYVPGWRIKRWPRKYCSHACRNYHEDMKGINRILRFPHRRGANRLELAGRKILDNIGVIYKEQQVINGKFVVDVLIQSKQIVIQWDGDFWHANPAIYPNPPIYPIQKTNHQRDKQCNAYLTKCGYKVLRFWETDVHNNSSTIESQIRLVLDNSDNT
jgi:very-short-patch-repair endonuclease